jgi:hypothetical protein
MYLFLPEYGQAGGTEVLTGQSLYFRKHCNRLRLL